MAHFVSRCFCDFDIWSRDLNLNRNCELHFREQQI